MSSKYIHYKLHNPNNNFLFSEEELMTGHTKDHTKVMVDIWIASVFIVERFFKLVEMITYYFLCFLMSIHPPSIEDGFLDIEG